MKVDSQDLASMKCSTNVQSELSLQHCTVQYDEGQSNRREIRNYMWILLLEFCLTGIH